MRLTTLLVGLLVTAPALADPLSRAQVVSRALDANPDVKKSLEDLAILNGRKDQALADALPELKLVGSLNRYRDPALLNSSSFKTPSRRS